MTFCRYAPAKETLTNYDLEISISPVPVEGLDETINDQPPHMIMITLANDF